ncbi:MBL fold metallo-hydrolase [candidate division WOR-3 bacterium]|nr:MBL fold metallo-hydrolase [candidate division WOR-3 bacterium]
MSVIITITILYDNRPGNPAMKPEWGFACLVQGTEKTVLFDTGGDGKIFVNNFTASEIPFDAIDAVMISHDHWDHNGGLQSFLALNPSVEVYVLSTFSEKTRSFVINAGATLIESDTLQELCSLVYTTGRLGSAIPEQALVIDTQKGLVVITGCAHPGILDMVRFVKDKFNKDIYMVFGGFHLMDKSDKQVRAIIAEFQALGVQKAGPCHCSGDQCIELFKEAYKEDFIDIGVGTVITLE